MHVLFSKYFSSMISKPIISAVLEPVHILLLTNIMITMYVCMYEPFVTLHLSNKCHQPISGCPSMYLLIHSLYICLYICHSIAKWSFVIYQSIFITFIFYQSIFRTVCLPFCFTVHVKSIDLYILGSSLLLRWAKKVY